MAWREVRSLRAEKTIVLAIAIQLFVAAFSSFLVVGLVSITDPGSTAGSYGIEVGISGEATDELDRVVEAGDSMEASVFETRDAAMAAFADREVDAVLHGIEGTEGRIHVDAVAPEGEFRTTLIVTQLKSALSSLERQRRLALADRLDRQPLHVPDSSEGNPYFGFTYTVLLPILCFLPSFISGSITADSIAEELERGTFELLRVTPLSVPQIVDGKALAMVAIAPLQTGAWLLLLALDGTRIVYPLAILLFVTAVTGVLVVIGAALAIGIRRRREAQLAFSLFALGLFGAAFLLPENPSNLVAKLAIGSPTATSALTLAAAVCAAAVGYWLVRSRLATGDRATRRRGA